MRKLTFLLVVLLNTACVYNDIPNRIKIADEIASTNNMEKSLITTGGFQIMSYQKIMRRGEPINIYIEGDGFAWASQGRLSTNPTPRNPVALQLASLDKSANIVYLARPCQYINFENDSFCEPKYWNGSKYSRIVVYSINQAIDKVKDNLDIGDINLIGYSGGGGIAVILGAMRNDVASIRSVAGNLDHVSFNRYHGVSQLDDSLNAVDYANELGNIPQMYISGADDSIVPPFLAEDFMKKIDNKNGCVSLKVLIGVEHHQGWKKHWNELITKPLECINKNAS